MRCKDCSFLGRFMEHNGVVTKFAAPCLNTESQNFGLLVGSGLWDIDWCNIDKKEKTLEPRPTEFHPAPEPACTPEEIYKREAQKGMATVSINGIDCPCFSYKLDLGKPVEIVFDESQCNDCGECEDLESDDDEDEWFNDAEGDEEEEEDD